MAPCLSRRTGVLPTSSTAPTTRGSSNQSGRSLCRILRNRCPRSHRRRQSAPESCLASVDEVMVTGASIVVAGDLRGHLIGTVSKDAGTPAVADAKLELHGLTRIGRWQRTTTSDADGFFQVDLPWGT